MGCPFGFRFEQGVPNKHTSLYIIFPKQIGTHEKLVGWLKTRAVLTAVSPLRLCSSFRFRALDGFFLGTSQQAFQASAILEICWLRPAIFAWEACLLCGGNCGDAGQEDDRCTPARFVLPPNSAHQALLPGSESCCALPDILPTSNSHSCREKAATGDPGGFLHVSLRSP